MAVFEPPVVTEAKVLAPNAVLPEPTKFARFPAVRPKKLLVEPVNCADTAFANTDEVVFSLLAMLV